MFRIHMLPAGHGDALWVEYGSDPGRPHRVLIDGGTAPTYTTLRRRIRALPADQRHFDLVVVTHVDADHIAGMVRLLNDDALEMRVDDVWFNDFRHLPSDVLGPVQGEFLAAVLGRRGWKSNRAFRGGAVVVKTPARPPVKTLPGGMKLTLLSPVPDGLARLADFWRNEVAAKGLQPTDQEAALELLRDRRDLRTLPGDALGPPRLDVEALAAEAYAPDTAPANGSSIAFLAEYDGVRCLFAGDAHPPVLEAALDPLVRGNEGRPIPLHAFKISHHASKGNLSPRLLEQVACENFLISTNGKYYKHPHPQAVARIVARRSGSTLWFNHRGTPAEPWDDVLLRAEYGYRTRFPHDGAGMVVDLS
jgi:beta-lactamase superfamily II metal-dependent hydrolase